MTSRRSDNQQRKQEVHSREYVVLDSEGEVELETGTEPFVEDPFGDFLDIDDSVADNAKYALLPCEVPMNTILERWKSTYTWIM